MLFRSIRIIFIHQYFIGGLLFFVTSIISYSQKKFIILDEQEKIGVSYALILFDNKAKGTYSDENGVFFIDESTDSIFISRVGFSSKYLSVNDHNNSIIYLTPSNTINEIVVLSKRNKKEIRKIVNWDKKNDGNFTNISQAALCIDDSSLIGRQITKAYFKFSGFKFRVKNESRIKRVKSESIIIRIRIYKASKNGEPGEDILNKNITKTLDVNAKYAIFNLDNEFIYISSNKIFISIEFLGCTTANNSFIPFDSKGEKGELQFTPSFSNSHNNSWSWFKENYNSNWKKILRNHDEINFNFSIDIL